MKYFYYLLNNSNILIYYMKELKFKLFYSFLTILITSLSCYLNVNQLIYFLTSYLLTNMNSHRFIFTNLTEVFFTYLKFSLILGCFFSIPFILFNFWLFFVPGFYRYEKLYLNIYLSIVSFLLIISLIINYNFILPNILKFFLYFEQNNNYFPIHFEAKLNDYLFLIISFLFNISFCFQIPSILILLIFFGLLEKKSLIIKRKYFYIFFILLSSLIAPPDIYNQFLLTFFIIFIYEIFVLSLLFFDKIFFIS